MRELSVCSTAIGTNEGPEICAYILWSQIVAVDAPLVCGQLEQPAYYPLVLLVLLHPARHRPPANPGEPSSGGSKREIPRGRAEERGPRRVGGGDQRKGSPLLLSPLSCFAGAARVSKKKEFSLVVGFYLPAEEKKAERRLAVNLRVWTG